MPTPQNGASQQPVKMERATKRGYLEKQSAAQSTVACACC